METNHLFFESPHLVLRDLLIERKLKNSSYSARAFARHLGLSQAFLSQVMNQKRKLSLEQKLKLADRLQLSLVAPKNETFEPLMMTLEHEKILKHWYHFAILELTQTRELRGDSKRVGQALGISELEASTAIHRLIEFGYLKKSRRNILTKTKLHFIIDAKKSSHSMRSFHQSRLRAAESELEGFEENRVEQRNFVTLFIPTSVARVQSANRLIEEFQQKLINHLISGDTDEVFQLSLQIFSAEKNPNSKTKKGINDET